MFLWLKLIMLCTINDMDLSNLHKGELPESFASFIYLSFGGSKLFFSGSVLLDNLLGITGLLSGIELAGFHIVFFCRLFSTENDLNWGSKLSILLKVYYLKFVR